MGSNFEFELCYFNFLTGLTKVKTSNYLAQMFCSFLELDFLDTISGHILSSCHFCELLERI